MNNPTPITTETLRRSTRIRRPIWKVKDNQDRGICSYSTSYDSLHEEDYTLQEEMMDPIASLAKTEEDTMYFH